MRILTKYECEICRKEYDSEQSALECEKREIRLSKFKVGDIVYVCAGFTWYDDRRWVINPRVKLGGIKEHGNCSGKCCTYAFYYVVTAITHRSCERHRLAYHVSTNAITRNRGFEGGFVTIPGHRELELIKNPPKFIVKDSKKLIGRSYTLLV